MANVLNLKELPENKKTEELSLKDYENPEFENIEDETNLNYEPNFISWTCPEIHHELISHRWRKAIIILLIAMAVLSIVWQGSILSAITFIGLALVTAMHFIHEIKHQRYAIHPKGVLVGDRLYEYKNLSSFWINYDPEGIKELSIEGKGLLSPYIKIPLGDQNPVEIRTALMNYLPEEQHPERIEDFLRRKLGF